MRRPVKKKNLVEADVKYDNVLISKFVNYLMRDGKKSIAQQVMYRALDTIEKISKQNPLDVFKKAIDNASPILEVKSQRVGGANYQVPREVRGERRFNLACRWLISSARKAKGKPMADKLAQELLAASKNEGAAVKRKEDMHRMAEANKAFTHFARN